MVSRPAGLRGAVAVAAVAVGSALVGVVALLTGTSAADGTAAYTRPVGDGSSRGGGAPAPLWCFRPPVERLVDLHRTCLADPSTPSGSPFLVIVGGGGGPAYDRAVGVESERRYRLGGLHPIALGDTLDGGRYQVVAKLGWGSFSTVWRVVDTAVPAGGRGEGDWRAPLREVAVKVWAARRRMMAAEEATYAGRLTVAAEREALAAAGVRTDKPHWKGDGEGGAAWGVDLPPPPPVMRQLRTFVTAGPHGRHPCAVFELLGASVEVALYAYRHTPAGRAGRRGAPLAAVQAVARDTLRAMAVAHRRGLLHTDLKIENVALRLPPLGGAAAASTANSCVAMLAAQARAANATATAAAAVAVEGEGQGSNDRGEAAAAADEAEVPSDVAAALAAATFFAPDGKCHTMDTAVVIDWGNAEELDEDGLLNVSYPIQTREYRAPEVIAGLPVNPATDMWSVGCVVWDVAVGDFLFDPAGSDTGDTTEQDIEHLTMMRDVMDAGGAGDGFPATFKVGSRHGHRLWGSEGALVGASPPRYVPLARRLQAVTDLPPAPRERLAHFLAQMLRLDPAARGDAEGLLRHPFLATAWDEREVGVPVPLPKGNDPDPAGGLGVAPPAPPGAAGWGEMGLGTAAGGASGAPR